MSTKQNNPFKAMAITSAILSQLAGGTLLGIFLGRWLDNQFTTSPLCLILCLFLGLAAGTYSTIRIVRKYTGEE